MVIMEQIHLLLVGVLQVPILGEPMGGLTLVILYILRVNYFTLEVTDG
jgi:hypothetical protein